MQLNCISPWEIAQILNKQNVKELLQMSTICVSFEIMVNEAMLNLSAWLIDDEGDVHTVHISEQNHIHIDSHNDETVHLRAVRCVKN